MYRVLTCLTVEHNWWLVALAAVVCFFASGATISLFHRARATLFHAQNMWIVTAGIAAGFGIWATHFVAMLAYQPGIPIGFDLALTSLSLVAAIAVTSFGLRVSLRKPSPWTAAAGGAIVGGGVASMHYLGMWAVEMPGSIVWQLDLVAASIVLGMVFGMAAMTIAARRDDIPSILAAAGLLTLAIVSHHFTAMGAVAIMPDPLRMVHPFSLSPSSMAFSIGAAAIAVLGVCIVAALADRRLAKKKREFDNTIGELTRRQMLIEETQGLLREQNVRFEAALENMSQGLCMFDGAQRLIVCNRRYADMYGLTAEQTKAGTTLQTILEYRVATGNCPADAKNYVGDRLAEVSAHEPYRAVNQLRDGRVIAVLHQPMEGGGWVAIHQDITEQKQAEARIAHMAHHDALTNLPNRVLFREEVEKHLPRVRRGESLAVLCLDLDHFKSVNDTLGHPIGDALLCAAADRLTKCLRDTDMVARLGGDEFAIVQTASEQPTGATALAQRLVEIMSEPFELEGHQVVVGASIGISVAPSDGMAADQLLKNADMALYRAKAEGRGTFHFFEPAMDARMQARRLMELDLRKALAAGEFELYYQPIMDVQSNSISAFEALLRWNHPVRGRVSPDEFIPVAEDIGLIVAIGEWVLRQACAEASTWPSHVGVAVNVSPAQFRSKNLVSAVVSALASSGLSPRRLEIEITETVLLHDRETVISILHNVRTLGVRIAMDDFGTGYSSLSFLRSFPFDRIKIDRSFTADACENEDASAIIRAVSGLGISLGMATTAEGVETQAQLDRVKAEGCTEVQGYFYSVPLPAAQVPALLSAFQHKTRVAA